MEQHKIKVGITHGDINGIGYEIIIKALADSRILEMCTPIVYGSSKVAAYYRKAMDNEKKRKFSKQQNTRKGFVNEKKYFKT